MYTYLYRYGVGDELGCIGNDNADRNHPERGKICHCNSLFQSQTYDVFPNCKFSHVLKRFS